MAVKVLAEFIGPVRELAGRSYLVLELSERADLGEALEALAKALGEERSKQLLELLSSKRAYILVNGLMVSDLNTKLSNMDKIYVFPVVSGG